MGSKVQLFTHKFISLFMSLALACGLSPALALANEQPNSSDAQIAVQDAIESNKGDYLTLMSEEPISKEEALELTKSLVASAIKGDPAEMAKKVLTWSSGKLLDQMFGTSDEKKEATLEDVLAAIDKLNSAINELQTTVNSQQLDDILNNLKPLLSNKTTYDVYAALRDIEEKQENGTYSDDEARRRVQSELTSSLGNGTLSDIGSLARIGDLSSFDRFTELLWSAITDTYHVTMSGKSQDMTLMQIWYEHMRYKYHWEHQAYDEWASFQAQCITLLSTSLSLEKASLQTRIELLQANNADATDPKDIHDEGSCINRLKTVQDRINQMGGYQGKGAYGEDVNYPGLFSETTWDNVYWLCKKRDESERYYWTPKHEALFFAQVNTQDVPPENDNAGLKESADNDGITVRWSSSGWYTSWDVTVHPKHWKKFLHYSGPGSNNSDLVSADQLVDMYRDYGKDKHLYDIFISKDEGNFVGLDESGISNWYFVVDPDSDHRIYFEKATWPTVQGEVRCYVITSPHADEDTANLETYTYSEAWRNKRRHFIGIGVKRYGPETLSGVSVPSPIEDEEHYTAVVSDSALWWPSCGDLTVSYDSEALGGVVDAAMDDVQIEPSDYQVDGDNFVLSKQYMMTLLLGQHKLELTCEHGTHEVTFFTKRDQIVTVTVSSVAGEKGVYLVEATTNGDGEITFASSDEAVATVDEAGLVTLHDAGAAIITATAAETELYAPGAASITVLSGGEGEPLSQAWAQDDNGTWYWAERGLPAVGAREIGGKSYLFDGNGAMVTGWVGTETGWVYFIESGSHEGAMAINQWAFDQKTGAWYYCGENGTPSTGWIWDAGVWYWCDPQSEGRPGKMHVGWYEEDGARYYFGANGAMFRSRWLCEEGSWYYFLSNGKMATGWQWVDGWYYFKDSGVMAANEWVDGYYLGASGLWAS